jgi:Tfp pilus assembly protein PilF
VYCAVLSPEAILFDGHYADDMTHSAIERELLRLLRADGFAIEDIPTADACDLVSHAARAARVIMPRIPRTYFLGRDILGLSDEHLGNTRSMRKDHELAALHARATDLLAAGESEAARPLLESYVAAVPDDAEGCAALGLCVLALGESDLASRYLDRAVWLEPESARHLWNLAAAAHASGQLGACYLALSRYLDCSDAGAATEINADELEQQRERARVFVLEYARLARLQHPYLEPEDVARAEERPRSGLPLTRARRRR